MLDAYSDKEAVFLDVGANIGGHALYAAAKGNQVYAIEPLTINLKLVSHTALQTFKVVLNFGFRWLSQPRNKRPKIMSPS